MGLDNKGLFFLNKQGKWLDHFLEQYLEEILIEIQSSNQMCFYQSFMYFWLEIDRKS